MLVKFVVVLFVLLQINSAAAEKYNVLFISADDLNTDLGCYGVDQVKTPNIDRLAKMGVRFDRAYCQQALCGPSRASVMTGLRPNTSGFVWLKDDLRKLQPDVVTLGQYFKQQGYYSGRVGKIYHYGNPKEIGTNGQDDEKTWTERFNPYGIDRSQEEKITVYPASRKGKGLGISMAWWDPESADDDHTDGKVASKAIELIEKHKDEPFFIAAGFFNPHCPYVAPKKYFDMYPLEEIKMQGLKEAKADLNDVPKMALKRDSKNWPYYMKDITYEEARKCKQAYYACVSFVDAQVGRLLDSLEKNNLMEKTIVIFWSDHGYFLGEKGLWYKRKNFERSVRAPMLMSGPGIVKGGECFSPVEFVDIYPSLVDMAGHKVPKGLDGVSLRPLLKNPKLQWNRPAISQVHYSPNEQGYSLRTQRWRYTEWNGGMAGRELYDHENDPHEVTNLADKEEHESLISTFSTQLKKYTSTYTAHKPPKGGETELDIFKKK
ncbi:MAG: sulfatase [Lentisphaeraceae bacterium]|nr:sulfatase [Lentisphaeraceae bacterium]